MLPTIKFKLHHNAGWDSVNSSLTKQLTLLEKQVLNLISSDNADPINIVNNAATILTDAILNIYNNLPEKIIKPNTSIAFSIQLLIKQKSKELLSKQGILYLSLPWTPFPEKFKKLIKSHRATDIFS